MLASLVVLSFLDANIICFKRNGQSFLFFLTSFWGFHTSFPLLVGSVLEVKRQDCQLQAIPLFLENKFGCQIQLLFYD